MAGRRLICFAMQSRRRRKKVGGRLLRAGDRAQPVPSVRSRHQRTQRVGMMRDPEGDMAAPRDFPQECCDGTVLATSSPVNAKTRFTAARKAVAMPSVDGCAIGFAGTPKDNRRSVGVMPQWLQRRNARAQSRRISVGELVLSAGTAIVTNEEARSGSFATRKIA